MIKMTLEDDPETVRKWMEEWAAAIAGNVPQIGGFEELPEDHPDYAYMQSIRQALIDKGIDPATVYPVDFDFATRQEPTEPVMVTMTFRYKDASGG